MDANYRFIGECIQKKEVEGFKNQTNTRRRCPSCSSAPEFFSGCDWICISLYFSGLAGFGQPKGKMLPNGCMVGREIRYTVLDGDTVHGIRWEYTV